MKFHVNGKVVVADPCYGIDSGKVLMLENVKKGKWFADISVDDDIVEYITAFYSCHDVDSEEWVMVGKVLVNSGQVVIMNENMYEPDNDGWYDELGYKSVIEGGLHCISGYGDGLYEVYIQEVGSEIVAIEVIFV